MTSEEVGEVTVPKKKQTAAEKREEHTARIKRTVTACAMGILTGVICYLAIDRTQLFGINGYTTLGLLVMITGVVLQRHIFILLNMAPTKLGAKDWFYQGFMTFALWFITWTLLLS
jgi:hypothetical protein